MEQTLIKSNTKLGGELEAFIWVLTFEYNVTKDERERERERERKRDESILLLLLRWYWQPLYKPSSTSTS